MKGDFYAREEIFDRVDGRLSQPFTNEEARSRSHPRARQLIRDDRSDR